MNDEQVPSLGEYIRYIRKAREMSVRQLAAQAGIDSGGLARLECGKVASPRPDTLRAIAVALDISLADLFVRAGYVVPHDLPSIHSYLRVKYASLPEEVRFLLAQDIEHMADIQAAKSTASGDREQ